MTYEELYSYLGLKNTPQICIDSRKTSPGDIFVAIKGNNFDGNNFAASTLQKGAKYVFIDNISVLPYNYDLPNKDLGKVTIIEDKYIIVDDTISALQELAKIHRNHFSGLVVAITGSCGKTTTKELLNSILSTKFKVYATPDNYNSHIGLPIALLKMPINTGIAIFEMGARNVGDIDLLCDIARPNMGLITNIKNVHLQGLKDITGVYKAKIELFDFLLKTKGKIFLNIDEDLLLEYFKDHSCSHKDLFHLYRYTVKNNATTGIDESFPLMLKKHRNNNSPYLHYSYNYSLKLEEKISKFCFLSSLEDDAFVTKPSMDGSVNEGIIATNILGNFNIYNITAALKIALHLGIKPEIAHEAVSNFKNPKNRLELMNTASNTILLDAYNSNLDSVLGAIDVLNSWKQHDNQKVLILGDINELGDLSDDIHTTIYKEMIKLISDNNLNYHLILLCGLNFYRAYNSDKNAILESIPNNNILYFENKLQLEQFLKKNKLIDKTILIKASRSLQLETLIRFL